MCIILHCRTTDKEDEDKKERKKDRKDKPKKQRKDDEADSEGEWETVKCGATIPSVIFDDVFIFYH